MISILANNGLIIGVITIVIVANNDYTYIYIYIHEGFHKWRQPKKGIMKRLFDECSGVFVSISSPRTVLDHSLAHIRSFF